MIENEQCDKSIDMENSTVPATKASSMKNRWHQTINSAVHCYQTSFNIAVILE